MNIVPLIPRCFSIILLCVSAPLTAARADHGVAPQSIAGAVRVDAEGLIDLVETVPGLAVIDARIASDRKQGYIQGSASLPDEQTDCRSLAKIVPERESPILFYCNGPKCGRSVVSVKIALDCGYSHVFWFRGGFQEWVDKGYPYLQE